MCVFVFSKKSESPPPSLANKKTAKKGTRFLGLFCCGLWVPCVPRRSVHRPHSTKGKVVFTARNSSRTCNDGPTRPSLSGVADQS